MPVTLSEVKRIVRKEFPNSDVSGLIEENHRVLGTIVWADFEGKDNRERSRMVNEKVRDSLGLKGLNLGVLFPLAPGETL